MLGEAPRRRGDDQNLLISQVSRRLTFDYKQNAAVPAEMKEILSQFDVTKDGCAHFFARGQRSANSGSASGYPRTAWAEASGIALERDSTRKVSAA